MEHSTVWPITLLSFFRTRIRNYLPCVLKSSAGSLRLVSIIARYALITGIVLILQIRYMLLFINLSQIRILTVIGNVSSRYPPHRTPFESLSVKCLIKTLPRMPLKHLWRYITESITVFAFYEVYRC